MGFRYEKYKETKYQLLFATLTIYIDREGKGGRDTNQAREGSQPNIRPMHASARPMLG